MHLSTQKKSGRRISSNLKSLFQFVRKYEHSSPAKYPTTKQWETMFQITLFLCFLNLPSHLAGSSTTSWGITQDILKSINTIPHNNSLAIRQCKSKWLIVSPTLLHILHPINNNKLMLPQILISQNSTQCCCPYKEFDLWRHFGTPVFQGKDNWEGDSKTLL